MEQKTVFIFDFDGTILDSFPSSQKILKKLAKKYNIVLPDNNDLEFKIIWGRGGHNMIKHWFQDRNHKKVHQEWRKLEAKMKVNLVNGTEETIRKLRKAGFVAGLVTNRSWGSLKQYKNLLKSLNFDFIQTSEYKKLDRIISALNPFKKHLTTRYFKPEPEVFLSILRALKKQNIVPKKIICVDDSLVGFEAAFWANLRLGPQIEFIGVLTGPIRTEEEWCKIVKTARINKKCPVLFSVAELPDWLNKNLKEMKIHLFYLQKS